MNFEALVLFGPTASGKTEILEALFASPSPLRPAEVISADSMQVYRNLNIGTAKPSAALRAKLPHHLIDLCDADACFNAGDFVRLAKTAIQDIKNRGKLPVVAGGTGFYINNLINGLPESPPSSLEIRESLKKEFENGGREALLAELETADAASFARINKNDTYRLLRALEVFRLTGRPLSSFKMNGGAGGNFLVVVLERERGDLYRRIEKRTRAMFEEGLAEEARTLFERGFTPENSALRAIGYKEFFYKDAEGGFHFRKDFPAVEAAISQNSRHYARRQVLYGKSFAGANIAYLTEGGASGAERVSQILRRVL